MMTNDNLMLEAQKLYEKASRNSNAGNYSEAEKQYCEALELYSKLPKEEKNKRLLEIAEIVQDYAGVFYEQNQSEKAEKYANYALELFVKLDKEEPGKYLSNISLSFHSLAKLYQQKDDFLESDRYYKKALELILRALENSNDDDLLFQEALILKNHALLLKEQPFLKKIAKDTLSRSLGVFEKLESKHPKKYIEFIIEVKNYINGLG